MSGETGGGQQKLIIKKKNVHYPPNPHQSGNDKIEKESEVDAQTRYRIKRSSSSSVCVSRQRRKSSSSKCAKAPTGTQLPLNAQPANDSIAQDLEIALGSAADERWATYLANYEPSFGTKFKTKLRLSPFEVHDNGYQVVTVAFTHANHKFATDNYIFGLSMLPGKNNAGIQLNLSATPAKKSKPAKKSQGRQEAEEGKGREATEALDHEPIGRDGRVTRDAASGALRSWVEPERGAARARGVRAPGAGATGVRAQRPTIPVGPRAARSARCHARAASGRLVATPDTGVQGPAGRRERDHREPQPTGGRVQRRTTSTTTISRTRNSIPARIRIGADPGPRAARPPRHADTVTARSASLA